MARKGGGDSILKWTENFPKVVTGNSDPLQPCDFVTKMM